MILRILLVLCFLRLCVGTIRGLIKWAILRFPMLSEPTVPGPLWLLLSKYDRIQIAAALELRRRIAHGELSEDELEYLRRDAAS